jgi:hypothetical protein
MQKRVSLVVSSKRGLKRVFTWVLEYRIVSLVVSRKIGLKLSKPSGWRANVSRIVPSKKGLKQSYWLQYRYNLLVLGFNYQ